MPSSLTPQQFEFLSVFLKENSGYQLETGKEYVLQSRLPSILQSSGLSDTDQLVSVLKSEPKGSTASLMLQSMTINETMFFRDKTPFSNIIDHILPALTAAGSPRRINFWSAACSSGQEPYSLAMVLDSVKNQYPGWSFRITATDLSEEMLTRARKALYSDFEVNRGLPQDLRDKYFTKENGQWQVSDKIRSMVDFSAVNLLNIPAALGKFDVILCRNVLIYFSTAQKSAILSSLRGMSQSGGYLMVGSTEILSELTTHYKIHPSWKGVYTAQ